MAKPNGVVLFRGPSLIDGRPIVCIATGLTSRSRNGKTGNMISTYILRADSDPVSAIDRGHDESVCGMCRHRPALGGTCYVRVHQAPLAVWRTWKAGGYRRFSERRHGQLFDGRTLRLGSYGDPAAVPLERWLPILYAVDGHTGYTHQWQTCDQNWRQWLMASVDSQAERAEADAAGWRTFRVRAHGAPLLDREFSCPASAEAGRRLTCNDCLACSGATSSTWAASPSIEAHGRSARLFSLPMVW